MLDYVLLTLLVGAAVNRIVEVWNHSEIMTYPRLLFKNGFVKFPFSGAALCPYCLSHWPAAVLTAVIFFGLSLNWWLSPVVWLASVFVANSLNDNLKSKTPRTNYNEDLELAKSDVSTSSNA